MVLLHILLRVFYLIAPDPADDEEDNLALLGEEPDMDESELSEEVRVICSAITTDHTVHSACSTSPRMHRMVFYLKGSIYMYIRFKFMSSALCRETACRR